MTIPQDIMEAAHSLYGSFTGSERYDVEYIAKALLAERERCGVFEIDKAMQAMLVAAREQGARAERERSGGASAINFRGKLIVMHPDMPPHMWDGENFRRLGI